MLIPGNLGMLIDAWISRAGCRLLETGAWISERLSRGCLSLGISAWISGRLSQGLLGCADLLILADFGAAEWRVKLKADADFSVALVAQI